MDLTNEQWAVLEPHIPEPAKRPDGKGRPRVESRAILDGILWVLRTGAPWEDLPDRYPAYQTCHRRFQEWRKLGVMEKLLHVLATDLFQRGKLDVSETFIDGTFASAKKGVLAWVKRSGEKGPKIMAIADSSGLPLAVSIASASPHEGTLVEQTLAQKFIDAKPERMIGDKAYDNDPLDARLANEQNIELIAPNRINKKIQSQDLRVLRR